MTYQNDYIGGSLTSLTNSGRLSGAAYGVYVASTGTLSTLTNSGTISGTDYAIYNAGSLGLVTNSGLISGSIYSSANLSIAWRQRHLRHPVGRHHHRRQFRHRHLALTSAICGCWTG